MGMTLTQKILAQHDVQLCVDELACLDLGQTGMCG